MYKRQPAVLSQEEIDKQKDAAIRQLAARGQQMASKGAPRAQVGSQMGQVRQPFKGGGGLRQMVQLPTNRVQFGKTAYQDVTEEQEKGFFDRFLDRFDPMQQAGQSGTRRYQMAVDRLGGGNRELDIITDPASPNRSIAIDEGPALGPMISAAPAALTGDGGVAAEVEALSGSLGEAPKACLLYTSPSPRD